MGQTPVSDQQAGFAGGLNAVSDPAFLGPDQARQLVNYRLSTFGAALRRLGTQFVSSALTTFDSGEYGGIYWPTQNTIYVSAAGPASTAQHLWSTTYGSFPRTWADNGVLPQYRPIVFTDNNTPEVLYVAGDNTQPVYKAVPAFVSITVDATSSNFGTASSFTQSHVFGSGTNGAFFVLVGTNGGTVSSVAIDPTGLNLPLTKVGRFTAPGVVSALEIWQLIGAATSGLGAKNVKTTFQASTSFTISQISLFGVNQAMPLEMTSPRTANGLAGTEPALTLPSFPNELVLDLVRSDQNSDVVHPNAGETAIFGFTGQCSAAYATGAQPSLAVGWTGATGNWIEVAVSLRPQAATPSLTISQLPGTVPGVAGLCLYNDRLWGWNSEGYPNSLYYSNLSSTDGSIAGDSLGDPNTFGGEIVVRTFGLQTIVACAAVNGVLVIWHQRGISTLTGWGQSDIDVQPQALNADIGMGNGTPDGVCVADELTAGDMAYFVTQAGLYRTNGSSVAPVSAPNIYYAQPGAPPRPDPIAALLQAGTITPAQCTLRFNRQFNEVWVAVAGIGIYVYNVVLQAWSGPFTGSYAAGFRQLFEVTDTAGVSHLWRVVYTLAGGVTVSECDRANTFLDDVAAAGTGGTTVQGTLQMRRMFGQDAPRVASKSWRWINVLATLPSGAAPPVLSSVTQFGGTGLNTFASTTSIESSYYLSPGGMGPWIDCTITDAVTNGLSQYTLATAQGNLLGQR